MKPPTHIEFLDRPAYRQRRFRDGARLLPLVAAVLMFLPLMWPRDAPDQSLTSSGMIYMFVLWLGLVIGAFVLSRVLKLDPDAGGAVRDVDEDQGAGH